jgi:diadenosine tetraphosphate (Ap4A) HIT family hydrolase
MPPESACPLCAGTGGELVWRDARLRVILADEPLYPGFTRVVWNAHVAEMGELGDADRAWLLEVLVRCERVMRTVLAPAKVNLASLGNQVPHLHWHVIPRWPDDPHFPQAVWAATDPDRVAAARGRFEAVASRLPAYRRALREALGAPDGGHGD